MYVYVLVTCLLHQLLKTLTHTHTHSYIDKFSCKQTFTAKGEYENFSTSYRSGVHLLNGVEREEVGGKMCCSIEAI